MLKHQKSFCSNIWFYKVWVDFTWNPPDFMVKSARFHGFHGFHEICWISWWNLPDFTDFMKSTGFHGEICQISWWNPPDFMVKSARFHGFHGEIRRISWMWAFGWWSSIGLSIERPKRFAKLQTWQSIQKKTSKLQVMNPGVKMEATGGGARSFPTIVDSMGTTNRHI